MEGRLSESYQKYCKRNKIDIDGSYCNIISIVLKSDDAQRLEHLTQQFKSIIRKLNIIENKMTTEEWRLDDNIDLLLDTFGDQQIFNERYACNDFGKQCIIALKIRYKKVLSLKRKLIDKNDMINTVKDIRAIIKIQSIINSESNGYIGGDYELAIMSLSKRNENNNLGEFEQVVLDKLKITEYEGKRDSRIKK